MSQETEKPPTQTPLKNGQRLASEESVTVTPKRGARCSALTKAGNSCPQFAMIGETRCAFHVPGNAQRFGQRGGARRALYNPDELTPFAAPTSAREQAAILAQLEVETHEGKIDPKVASTISTIANAYLSALELVEFSEKLRELEERVGVDDPMSQLRRDSDTGRFTQ
jgi:hypothetical protein